MKEIDKNSANLKDNKKYKNELQFIVKKTEDPILRKIIKKKLLINK